MRIPWVLLLLLFAVSSASQVPSAPELRIGAGDLLSVKVFNAPELTQDARVSASGEIVLALLGPVRVQDKTPREAELLLEQRLKDGSYLNNPHVTVAIAEYATQGISILGEVQKPGIYALPGARRLYDVISVAGGTTLRAGRLVTITHREQPDKPVSLELTQDPAKSSESNVPVLPGDTIVVAKAGIVYVVGDVGRPGGFVMDNNERLTVLQAMALAGGANRSASLGKARIIRRSQTALEDVPIQLNRVLSAHAQDVPLQSEDILFVPSSAAKSAMRRSAEAVLQITTGVAIYRPL